MDRYITISKVPHKRHISVSDSEISDSNDNNTEHLPDHSCDDVVTGHRDSSFLQNLDVWNASENDDGYVEDEQLDDENGSEESGDCVEVDEPLRKNRKPPIQRKRALAGANSTSLPNYLFNKWKRSFDWIEYSKDVNRIFCSRCKAAGLRNTGTVEGFGRNGGRWKKDTLIKHKKSLEHQSCGIVEKLQIDSQKAQATARVKASPGVKCLFRITLFVVQTEKSIRSIHNQIELTELNLAEMNAKEHLPSKHVASCSSGQSYATYAKLNALNRSVLDEQVDKIRERNAFSIHLDESTDIKQQKLLLVYAKYLDVKAKRVNLEYLGILALEHCDADGITHAVGNYLRKLALDGAKIVMMTSDGASVMLGKHNGVHQKLRTYFNNQHLIEFHCSAHRQALVVKDAYDNIPLLQYLEDLLREIIYFSGLNRSQRILNELAEELETRFVKIGKIHSIRWLSRGIVIGKIVRNLAVLLLALERTQNEQLLTQLSNFKTLLLLHHVADILAVMNCLNQKLQQHNLHPIEALDCVKAVVSRINNTYIEGWHPGTNVVSFLEAVDNRSLVLRQTRQSGDKRRVKHAIHCLANNLLDGMKARFYDEHEILEQCRIFDPTFAEANFDAGYGSSQIKSLHGFYKQKLSAKLPDVVEAWNGFKWEFLNPEYDRSRRPIDWTQSMWMILGDDRWGPLHQLAEILLCFDASNASIERGFSLMNRTVTPIRNKTGVRFVTFNRGLFDH